MDHANVKKICHSCMAKHNFSVNPTAKGPTQVCNLCKKNIETEKFQDHLVEHEMKDGTISCVVCSSIFTSISGLKDHIRDHNLSALDLKEVCPKCSSRYLYPSELKHHLQEHEIAEAQAKEENPEAESDELIKDFKEEEDDEDYIEVADNS